MKELEKQISIILKQMEDMIKKNKSKKEIEEKREELDELLRKYLNK